MNHRTSCNRCPVPGGRHCQCSRDYTRELALWMWSRLCSCIRNPRLEWVAFLIMAIAFGAVMWKK